MSRHKTRKLLELKTMSNVFEDSCQFAGKWNRDYFHNDHPIILELGCGKGEYSIALAKRFPDNNFIGIDIKGARLWRAAKDTIQSGLQNVVFLKILIEKIEECFSNEEVSEIWLPFPDPYTKPSKAKKRLMSPRYLAYYKRILKKEGKIHIKTDNEQLYQYALEIIHREGHSLLNSADDLYHSDILDEYNSIPSYFESIFLEQGKTIKYICFRLKSSN